MVDEPHRATSRWREGHGTGLGRDAQHHQELGQQPETDLVEWCFHQNLQRRERRVDVHPTNLPIEPLRLAAYLLHPQT